MTWLETMQMLGCGAVLLDDREQIVASNEFVQDMNSQQPRTFQDLLTPGSQLFWETIGRPLLATQGNVRDLSLDLARDENAVTCLVYAARAGDETFLLLVSYEAREKFKEVVLESATRRSADRAEAARLAALEEMRTDFINDIAHQVATPMTPAKMHLAQLQRLAREHPDVPMTNPVQGLARSIERLQAFHDSVVNAARVHAGAAGRAADRIDLHDVVAETVADWERRRQPAQTIRLALTEHPVMANVGEVQTCLVHILDNAMRYGPKDGVIEIAMDKDAPNVHVLDDGGGFPRQAPGRLQAFQKPKAALSLGVGSGLGLYVTDGLMRAQGGQLSLHERPEGGADACLRFAPLEASVHSA